MTVILNATEIRLSEFMGKARNRRGQSCRDRQINTDRDPEKIHRDGYGAELAFCKYWNAYPDTEIYHETLPDVDVRLKGFDIDVKYTYRRDGDLLVPHWKRDKACDVYALVIGEFPEYEIVGYARREQVFRNENLRELRPNCPSYVVPRSELAKSIYSMP